MGIESHKISEAALEKIQHQGKTLGRIGEDLKGTSLRADVGRRLVNSMSWNDYCYKLGLYLLAVALFGVIVSLIVYKYFLSRNSSLYSS